MESQANLHVIDIISLNPETTDDNCIQNYEMTGVGKENEKNEKVGTTNREILLDENLNQKSNEIIQEDSKK